MHAPYGSPYGAPPDAHAPQVDDAARYAPGAKLGSYSPFTGTGPPLVVYPVQEPKRIDPKVWWITGGSVLGLVAIIALVKALGGGSDAGGTSRDQVIEKSLAALAAEDLDKLEALAMPSDLRVNDCKSQDAKEVRKRMRNSHREAVRRLRRYKDRKDLEKVKIAVVDIEDDLDPSHYHKGSPAMSVRSEECEYTLDLTVHRLRVDVRVNGDIEDQMRIAAIELDGKWYFADFLLGGAIMDDRSRDFDLDP